LKINCITPYPELIENIPFIDSINSPETFFSFDSSYYELIVRNDKNENVIAHNLKRLNIDQYSYKSSFYLIQNEISWAENKIKHLSKPLIAISTKSKEEIKNWPTKNWDDLVIKLSKQFSIIHLGDTSEPTIEKVNRFTGKFTMRESAALLSQCKLFIGPDSLLMHIANGLDVKSIIIFGDARPVNCLGYSENINLASSNGCWGDKDQSSREQYYEFNASISPETVLSSIQSCI
jgi:ADP-heptose:LPS heptosyltransferase